MNSLTPVIKTMLSAARQTQGRPMRRSLPYAFIEVVQLENGNVQLTIERYNDAPTEDDWKRVLSAWPERVPDGVVPTRRTEGRRHILIGRWPRPAEVSVPAG